MSQITSPIILDSTGQGIVDAIESLSNRANDIENFTSSDVADGSATAWTSVTPLASGEVHSSIFAKISQMFKNIRYLYKMLGTTNISSIGGGTVTGAISTLNSNTTIDVSNNHTVVPIGSDFNSYTTPGVYYVMSDSDGATMANTPRKSSGKLIVMARHTAGYLAQYYYPSTGTFIRYVRSYYNGWGAWIEEHIDYYNSANKAFDIGSISSASTKTFEECGLSKFQYGTYYVILRGDVAPDATWVGVIRHNASGYQVSEIYKGDVAAAPIIGSDGVIKTGTSTGTPFQALVFPIIVWLGEL